MVIHKKIQRCFRYICGLSILLLFAVPSRASAACSATVQSCSTNYSVGETFFGTGGELNTCSTAYCAKQSAGETGVGNTTSTNYQSQAGFNSDRTPSLTFVVPAQNVNFGVLTAGTPKTATATFSVKSYLSSGYIVQVQGTAPKNATRQLTALATATASSSAVEQFGMNLAANTSPNTVGSVPVQVPGSTYGFGTAAAGYNTANLYRFNTGDTIAQSLKSSGETDFTISYLINTTALTPGGTYTTNQVLVATATF